MQQTDGNFAQRIRTCPLEELYLVTPQYLIPYLEYIRENRRLVRTLIHHAGLFRWRNTYDRMFRDIFSPILDRYRQPEHTKPYLLTFYVQGLMAIVNLWLEGDCREPVEEIAALMQQCVSPIRK